MNQAGRRAQPKHQPTGMTCRSKVATGTIALFLPVFTLAVAVTVTILSAGDRARMVAFRDELRHVIRMVADGLDADILLASSDLAILANEVELAELWGDDGTPIPEIRQSLAEGYLNFATYRGQYDQLRLLDQHGMEIIRVNYNSGRPSAVPREELQNKKGRYYFDDAFKLDRGEVFVSPFDLNIERGEIEQPLKPMIRFATPVFDRLGRKRGIVLLNYLGARMIEQLTSQSAGFKGSQAMLLNADGYWLKGPSSEDEWGFMYEGRADRTFAKTRPDVWKRIEPEESCQFETQRGMFTAKTVHPLIEGQRSNTGMGKDDSADAAQLGADEYHWKVVLFVPSSVLYAERNDHRAHAATILMLLAAATSIGAWRVARAAVLRSQAEKERGRLEEQLSESKRLEAIGQLAGGVAHDFNNQLAGIIGYAELLQLRQKDEKGRRWVDMILQAAQRSADLTAQLLAFSRKGELRIARVDVHTVVGEVVSLLSHTIDRRIAIEQHLNANPAATMGDSSLLQNALLNLAINARDAMPDGGELVLATDVVALDRNFCRTHAHGVAPGTFIRVSFSDTGAGMDKETLAHIFEPFFTTKGVGAGTGLGLAAVYGTVRSHGGAIDVHSEPGHGTAFKVYLPIAPDADAGTDDPGPAEPTTAGAARILFADDEEAVRESSCEALRGLGYEVLPCEHGAAAVEYYRESWQDVDLVILDMMMPEMNGHDAFRAMHEINPDVKVLLLSGFSLDRRIQAVLDDGALDYLRKPFRLAELADRVSRALGRGTADSDTRG